MWTSPSEPPDRSGRRLGPASELVLIPIMPFMWLPRGGGGKCPGILAVAAEVEASSPFCISLLIHVRRFASAFSLKTSGTNSDLPATEFCRRLKGSVSSRESASSKGA